RNRPDVQLKFDFCDAQAYYLAECLREIPSDVPVCLIGYSMGGRIIPAALHLLASGKVDCRRLPECDAEKAASKRAAPLTVLIIAAAVDSDCLDSCGIYHLALSQARLMLVVRNCCDPVLKWYPRVYGRRGPEALGYVGPCGCGAHDNLQEIELTCEVGRAHEWEHYILSCTLLKALDRCVFFSSLEHAKP
ncbi:MAG: hypothetical protein ACWGMZ_11055, partial [Thermoguttaceae bacterium]